MSRDTTALWRLRDHIVVSRKAIPTKGVPSGEDLIDGLGANSLSFIG